MGCAASSPMLDDQDPYYEHKITNDAIEQLLARPQNDRHHLKLLLLGTGESGKSTVLKQMRLLHQNGFSHQERLQYAQVIWADAIQGIKILIVQARRLGIKLDCDQPGSPLVSCKRNILNYNALADIDTGVAGGSTFIKDYVVKYSRKSELKRRELSTGKLATIPWEEPRLDAKDSEESDDDTMDATDSRSEIGPNSSGLVKSSGSTASPMAPQSEVSRQDVAESISELWKHDTGIQECYRRSNEFQLEGSASYYFDNIKNFSRIDYVCSDDDILKGRIKTTGISETDFAIMGTKFKLLDAGGQRSERSKWIHCFEDITAVLFVMAISEYDQNLFEDNSVNRMLEAMHLFNQLCNSRWFYKTPFILFMNKMDIFERKILSSPIRKFFPQFQGGADLEEAVKFFENCFKNLNRTPKQIYIHRTCATDSQSMKFVLNAVTDMIIQQNLARSGMI